MPSTDSGSGSPSPATRSFTDRLEAGWERALDHLPLALVPAVSALLAVDNVRRVLAFEGAHFGIAFRFPSALPDLWTFVSLPSQGPGVHVSPALVLLPVLVLVRSALVAGLLGRVREILRTGGDDSADASEYDSADGYAFWTNARHYFVPVLGYEALVTTVSFAAFGVAVAALPLALLLLPLFLVASYLFYATPYLLVVADLGVGEALARSYEWALAGGPYLSYGAGYLLFVVVLSIVGTAVVVNLGAVGIALGAVLSAPVALALTFATTEFVVEMADSPELSDPYRWE